MGGNVEKIAELFPGVVTEAQDETTGELKKVVDFDLLRQHLSDELVEGDRERFRLDWPGKKASILKANTPITKTLRPVREDSVNFDTTQNIFIEGDNFEVLKVLQESYLGKIKMIYIDPPYNTGKDFIYRDNFAQDREEYEEEIGVRDDENGGKLVKNTETNGRYHSDWLSMMQERLIVARDLLTDDGVIFISIDDNEQANLRKLCDEIYGEENFVTQISWYKSYGKNESKFFSNNIEYILVYQRGNLDHEFMRPKEGLVEVRNLLAEAKASGRTPTEAQAELRRFYKNNPHLKGISSYSNVDETYDAWRTVSMEKPKDPQYFYDIIHPETGRPCKQPKKGWRMPEATAKKYIEQGLIVFGKDETSIPNRKYYLSEVESERAKNFIDNSDQGGKDMQILFSEGAPFDYPKALSVMRYIIQLGSLSDSLILDFFSGSGTTAHAVMQLNAEDGGNRKHIQVQLAEPTDPASEAYKAGYKTIPEISRERIRRAAKKIREDYAEQIAKRETPLDTGFRAYKLASSNFVDTSQHPSETTQSSLLDVTDNIKEGRSAEDLLTEVILDLGLTLDLPIEQRDIAGHSVFFVGGNSLVACFDDAVSLDIVDGIAAEKPLRVVFKDSSFANDETRINIDIRLKQLSPDTAVQVV